jgi:hypothetical protein
VIATNGSNDKVEIDSKAAKSMDKKTFVSDERGIDNCRMGANGTDDLMYNVHEYRSGG